MNTSRIGVGLRRGAVRRCTLCSKPATHHVWARFPLCAKHDEIVQRLTGNGEQHTGRRHPEWRNAGSRRYNEGT